MSTSVRDSILAAALALGVLAAPAVAAPLAPDAGLRGPGEVIAVQYGYGYGGHHHGGWGGHRHGWGHRHGHHHGHWGHHRGGWGGHHHHHRRHHGHW